MCAEARGLEVFAHTNPVRPNKVVVLVSVDSSGHPRPSLLSPYQVVWGPGSSEILLAVHAGTHAAQNLRERGVAALVVFTPPSAIYVQGDVRMLREVGGEVVFSLHPTRVREDRSEAAPILSEPLFDDSMVKAQYTRTLLALLEKG